MDHKKEWSWWYHLIGKNRDTGCQSLSDNSTVSFTNLPKYRKSSNKI